MPPWKPLEKSPDLAAVEERCRRLWDESGIHRFDPEGEGATFSVDTPPPYVSAAHLHVGHAMSYAQAEFVVRYQRMRGRRIFYPMGFDDNGLPTERYVERKHGVSKERTTRAEFRALCLEETAQTAEGYERLWRALGLSVDWSLRYSTIDDHCRRTAQRSFLELHAAGRVYRSDDPVFWDPHFGTALAQADLDTVSREAWLYDVRFDVRGAEPVAISTTRPELLPACVALYRHPDDERYRGLSAAAAVVPLVGHEVPVLADQEVDPHYGTGLMMVCTFGDADDVRRWKRDGLSTRVCIDEDGRLTDGAYAGLPVPEAQRRIVADLEATGALCDRRRVDQHVAVSERSGEPVEFVMRPQWFVRVLDLKDELLSRSAELRWHPDWMRHRLEEWIRGLRHDWNISRQRFYGVPFPVWLCRECSHPVLTAVGDLPVDPLEDTPPVEHCPDCDGALRGDPDVMDTWMTSSLTPQINANWAGSPERTAPLDWPMTVRVQAHEIVRTWLFYTLVKSHLHQGTLPWRDVMISGWGLNEQGRRISKRDLDPTRPPGTYNRYDPETVIGRYGADALRHWAATSHLGRDTRYHERDVKAGRKVVLKLWNAARFCLGVLAEGDGFDTDARRTEGAGRPPEDRWLLCRLDAVIGAATAAFDAYDYAAAREATDRFFWLDFADDWLEIAKDRFWNPGRYPPEAVAAARTTLWEALRTLLGLYAPFLPYVTEELYQRIYHPSEGTVSLHVASWPRPCDPPFPPVPEMEAVRAVLRAVRGLRTERRLSQGAELLRVTVDLTDVPAHLRGALTGMGRTLQAAARARELVFGEAHGMTEIPGVRVEIQTTET